MSSLHSDHNSGLFDLLSACSTEGGHLAFAHGFPSLSTGGWSLACAHGSLRFSPLSEKARPSIQFSKFFFFFFFRFVSLHTFSSTPSLISQFISFNISWINCSMLCRLLINGYKFTTQDGKGPGPFTILLYIIYMSVVSQQLKDIFYFYPYNISTEN